MEITIKAILYPINCTIIAERSTSAAVNFRIVLHCFNRDILHRQVL